MTYHRHKRYIFLCILGFEWGCTYKHIEDKNKVCDGCTQRKCIKCMLVHKIIRYIKTYTHTSLWKHRWHNSYFYRKSTQDTKFKSLKELFIFYLVLMPLAKAWMLQIPTPQLCLYNRQISYHKDGQTFLKKENL